MCVFHHLLQKETTFVDFLFIFVDNKALPKEFPSVRKEFAPFETYKETGDSIVSRLNGLVVLGIMTL